MALPQNPHLKSFLVDTLSRHECRRINFKWHEQHINPVGYHEVINALNNDTIGVMTSWLPHNAKAAYIASNTPDVLYGNIFVFPPSFNIGDAESRMSSVHEATHALQDIMLAGTFLRTEHEEGAAYFAGALFNLYLPPRLRYNVASATREIWKKAHVAAMDFSNNPPSDHRVGDAAISSLTSTILNDPEIADEIRKNPVVAEDGLLPYLPPP